jgi:cell division protein FtsZ
VDAPELDDRALVTVLASGFSDSSPDLSATEPMELTRVNPETMRPANPDTGRVYGDAPQGQQGGDQPLTPTRLLPQAPTPSGELANMAEDLHVPAIIRMTQGRLPIE